ncbi:hypothetical protein LIER_15023 [Lithospermum erythrorhizon]|uniref:Uncharacterized protein n=1 Tax=Lithospermum erythrorhizon TaxID=34254 RepID=A0AAV3Q3S9_LITER
MEAILLLLLLLASSQNIMATEQWEIKLRSNIEGPTADQVWPYLADFCKLYIMFPSEVSFCIQGTQGKPGLIRYDVTKIPSPSDPNTSIIQWTKEELLKIDATNKYVTYEIHENNVDVTKFIATMQVLPAGDDRGCTFKWTIVLAPIHGVTYEDFVGTLEGILTGIKSKIENLF